MRVARRRLRQIAWFVAIWALGVLAVGLLSLAIKLALRA